MKHNVALLSLTLACLLGLTGCAHYKAAPLYCIQKQNKAQAAQPAHNESNTASFEYKVLTPQECKHYLDRNVIAKGYQPVYIAIYNNSDHRLHFSNQNISLPVVPAYQVAQRVHTSTAKRVVGYGVVGLFIWPFLIPAVVDGLESEKANQLLDYDFDQKELRTQDVPPYGSIDGLIFVPSASFTSNFSLTLADQTTGKQLMLSTRMVQAKVE